MQQNFSAKSKLNIIKKVIISAKYHKILNEAECFASQKIQNKYDGALKLKDIKLN